MKKVVVTGSSGFIGSNLCRYLQARGYDIQPLLRRPAGIADDLPVVPRPVDCMIHLAGRAHVLADRESDPLHAFREANCANTLRVAKAALAAGASRFIFVSSIGVNGQQTCQQPFDEQSPPAPHADYAVSKYEAELQLQALVHGSAMELVIIRPPLVYAGHAPGNFHRLLRLIALGAPLPLRSVQNQRSMIALDNLVDFISTCIEHPAAANELFLVSDAEALAIHEVIDLLAAGMGNKPCLIAFPQNLIRWLATFLGRKSMYVQLCGSLAIDASKAGRLLGWQPPVAAQEALRRAGADYAAAGRK